ncbi:site-specific DNA-methyltransferase [Gelidibacter salicanalis]|uniref:site-specific DNA-methyltransferase (adenine-specific) n=1 Tax=Gelidibacter salicanalis TaxID=291193 RepID=A0A934KZM1_9FLAO|nr:site-specific DNA-methyltransferase [Gelidibacter salicanalis]MBJ7882505.1 site-specific DNA-methyltransferase [Gelidibacter salicanalis]
MPTLNWIGKDKVVSHHQDVPYRVLEHKYGFTAEKGDQKEPANSGNKIIHGDNLEALKSLLPEYEGKVKCVYIDPPYNTGEEKWTYNDNVNHPKIKKWIGEIVGDDELDLTRHDKWLCMMYPRLKLLSKLLDKDGVIFISIDDNENSRLKLICDEIFGQKSFVTTLVWEKKKKGTHLDKKRISIKEYIYVYCKNRQVFNGLIGEVKSKKETYPCINPGNKRASRIIPAGTKSTYREKNYKLSNGSKISAGNMFLELKGDLILEDGRLKNDVEVEAEWRYSQDNISLYAKKDELYFTRDLYLRREVYDTRYKKLKDLLQRVEYGTINDLKDEMIKELEKDEPDSKIIVELKNQISSLEDVHHFDNVDISNLNNTGWGSNEDGDEELRNIFGKKVFDFPKPTKLISKLLASTLFKNGIFLDSFAGSGTTGNSVLALNKIDGGNRKFILIEMEEYANKITAERIKKVSKGYQINDSTIEGLQGSFDYYELGLPLFDENQNLNEQVGLGKIREYIWFSETRTSFKEPNTESYYLGKKDESAYYFIYEKDCLTTLDFDALELIKTKGEQYVIYADNCLLPKDFMAKNNIIFKKIPRDITRF